MSHPDLTGKRVRLTRSLLAYDDDESLVVKRGAEATVRGPHGTGWRVVLDSHPQWAFGATADEIEVIE